MYLTNGGKFKPQNMQYSYNKKMFTRTTKPVRMYGSPDNQSRHVWSSAVPGKVSSWSTYQ